MGMPRQGTACRNREGPLHYFQKIRQKLHEKGIDLDLGNLDQESLSQLIAALRETSIEVDAENKTVRGYSAND